MKNTIQMCRFVLSECFAIPTIRLLFGLREKFMVQFIVHKILNTVINSIEEEN